MSIKSWKLEFYPKPADEAIGSPLEAAHHSLLKWQGLLPDNREKHSLTLEEGDLVGEETFSIGRNNCALCELTEQANAFNIDACIYCPMFTVLGKTCDEDGLWRGFLYRDEVQPMVDALTELSSFLEKEQ